MENGDQDMVKGSQISAEVRKALGKNGNEEQGRAGAVEVEAAQEVCEGTFRKLASGDLRWSPWVSCP